MKVGHESDLRRIVRPTRHLSESEQRTMDYYDTCIRRVFAITMYVGGPLAYGLMAYILSHAV